MCLWLYYLFIVEFVLDWNVFMIILFLIVDFLSDWNVTSNHLFELIIIHKKRQRHKQNR